MPQRRPNHTFSSPSDPSSRRQQDTLDPNQHQHLHDRASSAHTAVRSMSRTSSTGEYLESSNGSAMSQQQPNERRPRLARDLNLQDLAARGLAVVHSDKTRVSPIPEEASTSTSPVLTAAPTTTSTESGNTVRGGMTPAAVAHTPSYPFPRMAGFPHQLPKALPNGPTTPLSRQQMPATFDKQAIPASTTPTSNFAFEPARAPAYPHDFEFPAPNLYDLSLLLSAEPGLEAWWTTVVQIMRDIYKAERVTLAVPADTTDIDNVPWGQKATFNANQQDDLSLGYLGRGSSPFQSSNLDAPETPGNLYESTTSPTAMSRPSLYSRHSFTDFEANKQQTSQDRAPVMPSKRPSNLVRSKTQHPSPWAAAELHDDRPKLNKDALEEHDAAAESHQEIPSWEAPFLARFKGEGRVLPVLQALDYEADSMIDHSGIRRVLERGQPITLTRTYPYLPQGTHDPEQDSVDQRSSSKGSIDYKRPRKQRTDSVSKISSLLPGSLRNKNAAGADKAKATVSSCLDEEGRRPPTPNYEEFEQVPPSPWSQSPAPSPAVRADPKENPFFTDAMVDEDSFNPGASPASYTGLRPPEAIGVDNSRTVLHIPLAHVLLSKPTRTFRFDASALEQVSSTRSRDGSPDRKVASDSGRITPEHRRRHNSAPIAILSILSPLIPYPSHLRNSLAQLAPHMATSFSLCRHYSNLETELAGIRRRRPSTAGFGAVAPFGNNGEGSMFLAAGNALQQTPFGGSITSPSDYSAISRSTNPSPMVTPGWEYRSVSHIMDRRPPIGSPSASAGPQTVESYFASKEKLASKQEPPTPARERPRASSKDDSSGEKRLSFMSSVRFGNEASKSPDQIVEESYFEAEESGTSRAQRDGGQGGVLDLPSCELNVSRSSEPQKTDHSHHSVLHSYGADFTSTFQSLPPSSSLSTKTHPVPSATLRSGPLTSTVGDMPPPSDRLKGLILDSLPAHVFVALPQTGETVWVNSRFLSYRGQNVADLSADPWASIHPDDREGYLKAWGHSLRTGDQFSRTVRIKRFDGAYRWFYARAVASKDKRGVIMQFLGSYMDIHDQHIAELKAARQEEIEASEAKHRLLANLIPQIIFTATEDDGITFANDQWLSYTGQSFEASLGLGFMDFVHPEDLTRCRFPIDVGRKPTSSQQSPMPAGDATSRSSHNGKGTTSERLGDDGLSQQQAAGTSSLQPMQPSLSRSSSSSSESGYTLPTAELNELARNGIIKVTTDTSGRLSYTTEVRLRAKTGEYRWHLIRCVEIDTLDFGRGASSYFGSATDINDHKLLEAKLKEAMESKGRFLSNMSHEIRTPLIGISGMVSFLQDTTLNEEQRDYTNTIQTSANSLIMIINDILDLSKVDAGMMKLKHEWFHTRSLIEDVNELVSTMAIAKRLELNYLIEADVPAWVKGDKVRIRQVLLNVIGNAIKFTSEGEVFSRCKVYTEADDATTDHDEHDIMLEFAITDTGRGFTKKEAELIFKPFSQIDGSSTRQHGGSGLGLVISRQLVELHGGKMEGTAVPGKGSTFTFTARFTLPSAEDHPDATISPGLAVSTGSRLDSSKNVKPESNVTQTLEADQGNRSRGKDGGSSYPASNEPTSPLTKDDHDLSCVVPRHDQHAHLPSSLTSSSAGSGLARFSEAAKASGQDLSQINLEIPSKRTSPSRTSPALEARAPRTVGDFRPPMYSILIICPQQHSREATTQHIEMTLPKEVPHQITAIGTVGEAEPLVRGEDAITFTHIVLNLSSAEAIVSAIDQITKSQKIEGTAIVILTDSVQRQALQKLIADTEHERFVSEKTVSFIYKPVKPSRFAVIFDPDKVRDLSVDMNRSTAQQMLESQKASYQEIERRMGNKGYRVLLVEDNLVNQKVLSKYLKKIGVDVEVAVDGVECTEIVLSKPHDYYSLILCDLHMPRKDGYQACLEIREREKTLNLSKIPIIALSANVMSDVQEKCIAAGFSDYVTKPVDFIDLSRAMAKFF